MQYLQSLDILNCFEAPDYLRGVGEYRHTEVGNLAGTVHAFRKCNTRNVDVLKCSEAQSYSCGVSEHSHTQMGTQFM